MGGIAVVSFLIAEQPGIPPFYGLFIPILALAILALWGLNTLYSNYRKKRAIKQLERERYVRDGIMIVCSNCGTETMMKCPSCERPLYQKVMYCSTCGKPLEN